MINMNFFKKVRMYKKEPIEGTRLNYLFFCDEDGRDWYETREGWKGAVAVNSQNLICAYEQDVQRITMVEGQSVYEVIPEHVPDNPIGLFYYKEGEYIPVQDDYFINQKKQLIAESNNTISLLKVIQSYNPEDELVKEKIIKWEHYLVKLYYIDVSNADNITWPDKPIE